LNISNLGKKQRFWGIRFRTEKGRNSLGEKRNNHILFTKKPTSEIQRAVRRGEEKGGILRGTKLERWAFGHQKGGKELGRSEAELSERASLNETAGGGEEGVTHYNKT